MPTLAESTKPLDESLYQRIDPPATFQTEKPAPHIGTWAVTRSPVPPIAMSPDSVNIFKNGGNQIPQYRIISAVPIFQDANQNKTPGTTVTNTTVVTGSGGSGGGTTTSSTSTPPVTPTSVLSNTAFVTPVLSLGQVYQSSFALSANFILVQVAVSAPARVRLYSTAAGQSKDVGRITDVPVTLGSENSIIADLNLLTGLELVWSCSPIITGANGDSPQTASIYISVTNQSASSVPITVSFVYLPLT